MSVDAWLIELIISMREFVRQKLQLARQINCAQSSVSAKHDRYLGRLFIGMNDYFDFV